MADDQTNDSDEEDLGYNGAGTWSRADILGALGATGATLDTPTAHPTALSSADLPGALTTPDQATAALTAYQASSGQPVPPAGQVSYGSPPGPAPGTAPPTPSPAPGGAAAAVNPADIEMTPEPGAGLPAAPSQGQAVPKPPTNEDQAAQQAAAGQIQAGQAENASQADLANRKAGAIEGGVASMETEEGRKERVRAAADAEADGRSAKMIEERMEQAKKEPDPHRFWHNQSAFGKAMWALSLGLGVFAGGKNPGAEMLVQSINQDVAEQKDALAKQAEVLKAKGDLQAAQAKRTQLENFDDHMAVLDRINATEKAFEARAGAPGSVQDMATAAKGRALLGEMRMQTMHEAIKDNRETARARMQQEYETGRTAMNNKTTIAGHIIQGEYALAGKSIEESAKVQAAQGKAGLRDETYKLAPASGVFATDKAGNRVPLSWSKDEQKDHDVVTAAVDNVGKMNNGINKVVKALQNEGDVDHLLNFDPDVQAAMSQLSDPMAKQLGIRLTTSNEGIVQQYMSGGKLGSLADNVFKDHPEDSIRVLKDLQRGLPGTVKQTILAHSKQLADNPDLDVKVGFNDTLGEDARELTPAQIRTAKTGESTPIPDVSETYDPETPLIGGRKRVLPVAEVDRATKSLPLDDPYRTAIAASREELLGTKEEGPGGLPSDVPKIEAKELSQLPDATSKDPKAARLHTLARVAIHSLAMAAEQKQNDHLDELTREVRHTLRDWGDSDQVTDKAPLTKHIGAGPLGENIGLLDMAHRHNIDIDETQTDQIQELIQEVNKRLAAGVGK